MVHSDPAIMAGAPVFRGTRVPVYLIADMIEHGTPIAEILEGYPSLTREMVGYAGIYATTHPRRGRPPEAKRLWYSAIKNRIARARGSSPLAAARLDWDLTKSVTSR